MRSRRRILTAFAGIALCAAIGAACAPQQPRQAAVPSAASAPGKEFRLTGVREFTKIADLTGPNAINKTEEASVAGTDLGWQLNAGDKTYFVFGDTFGERDEGAEGGVGKFWRSNVAAYTTDKDPSDGITFDGWIADDLGLATALVEGKHEADGMGEVTKIPTYGFAIGETLYLHFMSVHHWGPNGTWDANYAALAKSTDEGKTWQVLDVTWPGDSNFIQLATATARDGDTEYLYLWGIPGGRHGDVKLARVPATSQAVEDLTSYEYFTGATDDGGATWSDDLAKAAVVMEGPCGEFSVAYNPHLGNWTLAQYNDGSSTASIREGLSPWGPWGKEFTFADQASHPGLYAPYLNPKYVADDGKRVFLTMSRWGPYNVAWYSLDLETK